MNMRFGQDEKDSPTLSGSCRCLYTSLSLSIYIYIYIWVCTYIYIYTHREREILYIYIYTHTYMPVSGKNSVSYAQAVALWSSVDIPYLCWSLSSWFLRLLLWSVFSLGIRHGRKPNMTLQRLSRSGHHRLLLNLCKRKSTFWTFGTNNQALSGKVLQWHVLPVSTWLVAKVALAYDTRDTKDQPAVEGFGLVFSATLLATTLTIGCTEKWLALPPICKG